MHVDIKGADIKGAALAAVCSACVSAGLLVTAPAVPAEPATEPSPSPSPSPDVPVQPTTGDIAAQPGAVPHLSSPENLPPGTSIAPVGRPQGRGLTYLRELWHAIQTQEVSGSDALLLLTQRPLNPDAPPPAGVAAGPQPAPAVPQPAPSP